MSEEFGGTYTVKERIQMLERTITDQITGLATRLDRIDRKLDEKASNARVFAIEDRLRLVEDRIGKLEIVQAGAAALSSFQRWVIGSVGAAMVIAGAELIYLAVGGH